MKRHFTATVYIVEDAKVLLIHHKKFGKWLPPGGHIDPNETPPEAARREAHEETGLEIEFIQQENVWIDRWNATSMERPWMCLLENIPESPKDVAHQHMDMIFLAKPSGGSLQTNHGEANGLRWFTLDEIRLLRPDEEIFAETVDTLEVILA